MRISDWRSDVCSSDLVALAEPLLGFHAPRHRERAHDIADPGRREQLRHRIRLRTPRIADAEIGRTRTSFRAVADVRGGFPSPGDGGTHRTGHRGFDLHATGGSRRGDCLRTDHAHASYDADTVNRIWRAF